MNPCRVHSQLDNQTYPELAENYSSFTEGLETADLRQGRDRLDIFSSANLPSVAGKFDTETSNARDVAQPSAVILGSSFDRSLDGFRRVVDSAGQSKQIDIAPDGPPNCARDIGTHEVDALNVRRP